MAKLTLTKQSNDDAIEAAFFQLAYDRLQDTLKNLLPYLIGFEIVKKSDDNTKGMGVFGFRSTSGQILYVPAFFIGGKVRPLDLLYSKNTEQFFPLTEEYAEMFLKDDMLAAGQASHENRQQLMRETPQGDYRGMTVPPRTGRYTTASVIDYVEKSDNKTKTAFADLLEKDAAFCEAVVAMYPLEKIAKAILKTDDGKKYRKGGDVAVVYPKDKEKAKELSKKDKEDLLTKGYAVVDKREDNQKSKFGEVGFLNKFSNPTESGFYSYVTVTGGLRYGLVLVSPDALQQYASNTETLVVDLDSGDKGTAYAKDVKNIFIKDQIKVRDYSTVHKMMVDAAEGKPGYSDIYVLINEELKATQPFRITANFKDDAGVRRIAVEPYTPHDYTCFGEHKPKGNFYQAPKKVRDLLLVMTKRQTGKLEHKGEFIYVPAGYKLLKLTFGADQEPMGDTLKADFAKKRNEAKEHYKKGEPGTIAAVNNVLTAKSIFPMSLRANGSDYFVDIAGAKKKYENPVDAKIAMTMEYGLDAKQAEELIESLNGYRTIKGYIKRAYTGDSYPQPIEEQPYANELGQPTTSGVGQESVLPPDQQYSGNPTALGLGTMPEVSGIDPKYVNQATQLAQSGQKEIFDTHMISTLAKYVSVGDKVTEYLPAMVEAMDRLGRILFLLHWETDKFKEMYGRSDLPELVELVTSVFKGLGDLVIFLKRRSPELSINMSDSGEAMV